MNPRVAIALLAIIVVLFVVGVGCGATHGSNDNQTSAGWADAIGNLLVKKATVDDLVLTSGACSKSADSLVVSAGPFSCTVQVVDRRRISLTVTQPSITLNVRQNKVGGPQDTKSDSTYEFILDKPSGDQPDQFVAKCTPLGGSTTCTLRVNG